MIRFSRNTFSFSKYFYYKRESSLNVFFKISRSCSSVSNTEKLSTYTHLPLNSRIFDRIREPLLSIKAMKKLMLVSSKHDADIYSIKKPDSLIMHTPIEDTFIPFFLYNQPKQKLFSINNTENDKEIQQKSFSYIIHDKLLQARYQYSFLIPVINHIFYDTYSSNEKLVIILPTKELVSIFYSSCLSLLPSKEDINKVLNLRNIPKYLNSKEFDNCRIILTTTEGISKMNSLSNKSILQNINFLIYYHMNTILSETNIESINDFYKHISPIRKTLIYTEEINNDITDFIKIYCPNIEWINRKKSTTLYPGNNITYNSIQVDEYSRFECLIRILNIYHKDKTIIYINSIDLIEVLATHLHSKGYSVEILHSKLDNKDRRKRFSSFLKGYNSIILASDILLQENDIKGCTLNIQYRLPIGSLGKFLHRTWKMGGLKDIGYNCYSFLLYFKEDKGYVETLKSKYYVDFQDIPIPSDNDNFQGLLNQCIRKLKNTTPKSSKQYLPVAKKLIKENGAENILSKAISLLINGNEGYNNNTTKEFKLLSQASEARIVRKEKIEKLEKKKEKKKLKIQENQKLIKQQKKKEKGTEWR